MVYIYKIVNDINDKVYVGKTTETIEERFKDHIRMVDRGVLYHRPLYCAMKKYGIKHFHIEVLEEVEDINILSDREIFWIAELDTYYNGYNATLGGDGRILYDYEAIANRLRDYPYAIQVAEEFGCHPWTVKNIARIYHIPLKILYLEEKKKKIARLDKKTEEILQIYESLQDAMKWCIENGYCASYGKGPASHISDAAKGKRKSAYQFKWAFI